MMGGYRIKGDTVIINGVKQHITPSPLPGSPTNGMFAIDQSDGKLKVWNQAESRWIILGDAIDVVFDNSTNGFIADNVQDAIEEIQADVNPLIVPVLMQHNGTVSNGTWLGYDSLLPGNSTPVVVPITGNFTGFTWSNSEASADFNLEFRKNSTGATPFYTWSVTNTLTANFNLPSPESFTAGDIIYVKYIDTGTNASDATLVLKFKS